MSTADQTPSMPPLPEPESFMYQHEDTGLIGYVDPWQIENGFEAANPRLQVVAPLFTAKQVHAYAQAVADERVRALEAELAGLRAARMAYASEFPPNADGEPDVGSIHANIREMKRKAARYDWLRDRNSELYSDPHGIFTAIRVKTPDGSFSHNDLVAGTEMDAAIDEAMMARTEARHES